MRSAKFEMIALPPFRLDLTVWALRRRAANIVDRWEDDRYSRTVVFGQDAFGLDISQTNESRGPVLHVALNGPSEIDAKMVESARLLILEMLAPAIDLRPFYALAERSDILGPLAREFRGLKPPRFPTLFEALVNAIACQQVSLDAGVRTLNRFSERFGARSARDAPAAHAFPRPEDLAASSEGDIKAIGLSRQKARAIKEIANGSGAHEAALAEADRMSGSAIVSYLSTIRGIGRWSAEYALLRRFGRPDVFPGDDVGARNNLQRLFHMDEKLDYDRTMELTAPWRPYRGFVYFHLLLNDLRAKGVI